MAQAMILHSMEVRLLHVMLMGPRHIWCNRVMARMSSVVSDIRDPLLPETVRFILRITQGERWGPLPL